MIAFEKWQGLGNDFIVVDVADLPADASDARIKALCDRRFGVGADGVLIVDRREGSVSMVVRNADGSRPEMCGNGLRCVLGRVLGGEGERTLDVLTDSGLLRCSVTRTGEGAVVAEVDMGVGRFEPESKHELGGRVVAFENVNMGNPHAITFEPFDAAEIDALGPLVERARAGGTNVEFVRAAADHLAIRVWERGVGYTLACGTGACAVVVAACRGGRARFDEWVRTELPGGPLEVRVERGTNRVRMRGPAVQVFKGVVD